MTFNPFVVVPLLVVLGALAFWLLTGNVRKQAAVRAMCLAQGLLATALATDIFYEPINDLVGLASFPHLLKHFAVLAAAYWLTIFCLHLSAPPESIATRARRRALLLGAALIGLTVFWYFGPRQAGIHDIAADHGGEAYVLHYLTVYTLYLGLAMADVALMSRHARHIPRRWLRIGLQLLGAGAIIGLLYVVQRVAAAAAVALGTNISWTENGTDKISQALILIAIALLMAGTLVPPIGTRRDARRARQALTPLWRDLTAQAPELVFGHQRGSKLRIMVTEIRDVLIGPLHHYLSPTAAAQARILAEEEGLTGVELETTVEAAMIAIALNAKRNDCPALTTTPVAVGGADHQDDASEVAWLTQVANAYSSSPVVTRALQESQPA